MSRDFAETINIAEEVRGGDFTKQDAKDIALWDRESLEWGQRVTVSQAHEAYESLANIGPVGDPVGSMYRRVGDLRLVIEIHDNETQAVVDTVPEARAVVTAWLRKIAPLGRPHNGMF